MLSIKIIITQAISTQKYYRSRQKML